MSKFITVLRGRNPVISVEMFAKMRLLVEKYPAVKAEAI
jgi:hypothetical protein